jgi:hypothetical protein
MAALMLETIITGATRQFHPWLRLHHEGNNIGRHPAAEQIRVSRIWEQDELHGLGYLQNGKDLIPQHLILLRGVECTRKQQPWAGFSSLRAIKCPMATEGEPHIAVLPRTNTPLDILQKSKQ